MLPIRAALAVALGLSTVALAPPVRAQSGTAPGAVAVDPPGKDPGAPVSALPPPTSAVPAPSVPIPGATVGRAVPAPTIPSPPIPAPTIPVPAIASPAISGPAIPTPAIPSPAAREVPPDARELFAGAIEADIAGRCLSEVSLRPAGPMPGQVAGEPARGGRAPATRVVIAVDASGSMAARSGAETKMAAALAAARRFLDGLGPEVEVGLVVFGHQGSARNEGRAASCRGVEARVPLSSEGRGATAAALGTLRPVGWTPLAAAMEEAARQFRPSDREGEQLLLVISDGVETCGGNPVEVARRLNTGNMRVVVDIVGFDIAANERAALEAVARAGGGTFLNVQGRDRAEEALRASRERTLNTLAAARAQTTANLANARNATRTNLAVARASSCVNLAISREATALNTAVARTRPPEAASREAQAMLRARHAEVLARFRDYEAALRGAEAAEAERTGRALTEALKPPSR